MSKFWITWRLSSAIAVDVRNALRITARCLKVWWRAVSSNSSSVTYVYPQIQLTQSQIQAITLQMQGKQPGQSIVIQTAPLDQQSQVDGTANTPETSQYSTPQVRLFSVALVSSYYICNQHCFGLLVDLGVSAFVRNFGDFWFTLL